MAITPDDLDQVRQALVDARGGDTERMSLRAEGDTVVLGGAVSTDAESAEAETLAGAFVDEVRNELAIDPGLREDPTEVAVAADDEGAGLDDPERWTRFATEEMGGAAVTDAEEAQQENVPWTPPDEPRVS